MRTAWWVRSSGKFEYNRQALLESVGRAARDAVASYDKEIEARELAESVQMAVAQTAIVEVGAVGLGALVVELVSTTVADVTGILAASAIAALGLYVIPNKRRQAKRDLQAKIADLRERLTQALTTQFEAELGRSLLRIREAIRPVHTLRGDRAGHSGRNPTVIARRAHGDGSVEGADRDAVRSQRL